MEDKKILFIDACPRVESRTRRLAEAFLGTLKGNVETVELAAEELPEMNDAKIKERTEDCRNGNFEGIMYRYAKQFSHADMIVIAAPFWDLSFPAILKKYLEAITVTGITFRYTQEGIPVGLCKADKLYYITTAGGPIVSEEYGYGYVKALATGMYGIPETEMIAVEYLDIQGNDAEAMINEAIGSLKENK